MTTQEPPRLEYPCPYPIKVVGEHAQDFVAVVLAIVQRHDAAVRAEQVRRRASAGDRYLSLTITITATGPDHIQALFADLKASGRVLVVL
jgi:putative lipoic acid-binding regulatory protein